MKLQVQSNFERETITIGLVRLRLGDVIQLEGRQYMVDLSNESRARCLPLTGKERTIKTLAGDEATFTSPGNPVSITNSLPRESIVERRGEAGLQEFLAAKSARRRDKTKTTPEPDTEPDGGQENGDENSMAKEKKKARGGLAASVAERKETEAKTPKLKKEKKPRAVKPASPETIKGVGKGGNNTGRKEKIFDHSVCAVLRRLGKEGVSAAHAKLIMAKRGIVMPDASLNVQVNFFSKKKEKPAADLTKDQIKELVESVAAPEPEPVAA